MITPSMKLYILDVLSKHLRQTTAANLDVCKELFANKSTRKLFIFLRLKWKKFISCFKDFNYQKLFVNC